MEQINQDEVFAEIRKSYGDLRETYRQDRLVELLREIQDLYGCIPEDAQALIVKELFVKQTVIRSILKYFPSLRSAVCHEITLCVGPSCSKEDSGALAEAVREEIRQRRNQKNGSFYRFTTKNCLKQCRNAPNLKLDDKIFSNVKTEEIKSIFKSVDA